MRKIFVISLFIFPTSLIAQKSFDTSIIKKKNNFKQQPAYFLDSTLIDLSKTYFDKNNIESIQVSKDTFWCNGKLKIGKVFINSKNKNHNWASLGDIQIKRSKDLDTTQLTIYIIDGNLISDTTNVKIEVNFVKSIDILNRTDTKNLFDEGPPKTIIVLNTKQTHIKSRKKRK